MARKTKTTKKRTTKTRKKAECQFCKDGIPHMFVILNEKGETHVHAPFANKYLMNQFIDAIIMEQRKFDNKSLEE